MLNLQNFGRLLKLYGSCRSTLLRKYSSHDDDLSSMLRKGSWSPLPLCHGRKIEEEDGCCPKYAAGACPYKRDNPCDYELECCYPNLKWECDKKEGMRPRRHKVVPEPFKSMWDTTSKKRSEVAERADDTLYTNSGKANRIYRRTWEECGPIRLRKKKICCFENAQPQPILEKRTGEKPTTACEQKERGLLRIGLTELQQCIQRDIPKKEDCFKVRTPCCQAPRKNLKCLKTRKIDCKRECTPYPSFSESMRDAAKQGHPIECKCVDVPPQCNVFEFEKIKHKYHLLPSVPAWPPVRPK